MGNERRCTDCGADCHMGTTGHASALSDWDTLCQVCWVNAYQAAVTAFDAARMQRIHQVTREANYGPATPSQHAGSAMVATGYLLQSTDDPSHLLFTRKPMDQEWEQAWRIYPVWDLTEIRLQSPRG